MISLTLQKDWKQEESASLALTEGNKIHLLVPLKQTFVSKELHVCQYFLSLSSSHTDV